jgi:G3E family GTPase
VISVIDVENWEGYEDTSYTAKMQARYTDLIIFNKWEGVSEQRFDVCLDRLGDLELDTPTPWVKSDRGKVDQDVLLGTDGALLAKTTDQNHLVNGHGDSHSHSHDHQSEVEVLSATLTTLDQNRDAAASINTSAFENLLRSAPKEEVYRIKGIIRCSASHQPPQNSDADTSGNNESTTKSTSPETQTQTRDYILNWAFGRWTFTPSTMQENTETIARLTFILARYESAKWKKKLEAGGLVEVAGDAGAGDLKVERLL